MSFVSRKDRSRQISHRLAAFPIAVLALSVMSTQAVGQPLPCQYQVTAVIQAPDGPISSSPTFGNGISPNGRYVVGSYRFDAVGADKAYYYDMQTKQFTPLPLLPGTFTSIAYDVNDAGQICGTIAIPAGDKGFIYQISTAQYTLLEPINPQGVCVATGITADGTVCGTRSIGSKGDPVFPKTAFMWSLQNGFTDLGVMDGPNSGALDIAEDGTVVGYTGGDSFTIGTRAFIHCQDAGTTVVITLPGALNSAARAIGSVAHIAMTGQMQVSPPITHGFIYDHEHQGFVPLGFLPGFDDTTFVEDVSASGIAVGFGRPVPGPDRGFVWQAGVLRNLDELLPANESITLRRGNAVAPNGRIVARGSDAGHDVVMVLDPIVVTGDAQPDCTVDVDDLISVILEWNETESPADVTGDGAVDVEDLILVIESWAF
jgi:uncharacterized membrane protein